VYGIQDIEMDKLIDSIMEKLLSGGYVREDEADIVRFGLELNIMKVLISAAMLVTAIIFGSAPSALVFMAVYPPLRSCCGGYHAKTRTACFILSMAVMSSVIAASRLMPSRALLPVGAAMGLTGLLLIILLAPVESRNKPFDDKERRVFRRRSLIAAAISAAVIALLAVLQAHRLMTASAMAVLFTGIMLAAGLFSNRKGALK
jgi:accessory gene regulator B